MGKILIIVFVIICISGCSFTRLATYMDVDNNQEWKMKQGVSVLRDSDFKQASWQYEAEDISINVQPIPLKQYTLTFGPAYLPIIPFYQFHLLFDLFYPTKETLSLEITVKNKNGNKFLDLRKIDAVVIDSNNINSKVYIDKDSSSIIDWEPIDFNSGDTLHSIIQLSEKAFTFQLRFSDCITETENIKIRIQGISSKEKYLFIPELYLLRKSKFHFDNLKFGV